MVIAFTTPYDDTEYKYSDVPVIIAVKGTQIIIAFNPMDGAENYECLYYSGIKIDKDHTYIPAAIPMGICNKHLNLVVVSETIEERSYTVRFRNTLGFPEVTVVRSS